ncbi:hypothetical protein M9Y10_004775 [Tritrichomonas musculus]|uniref:Uncharacterized protein n=1 Tax=Tritrichomonas musculus TaxID=1915356 RepID=A0ABR2JK48_9EUKA
MSTPQRNQTPRSTPSQTPGKTPGKTPTKSQSFASNNSIILLVIALVLSVLTGLGGYFVYSKAGKRGITYYGIAVSLVVITYFVFTKLLRKKKTD